MPYAQLNLAIDIFLIAVLSFGLLFRYPRFIIALFVLYLLPWIFPLGQKGLKFPTPPAPHAQAIPDQNPSYDLRSGVQIFSPEDSPQVKLGKTRDLYRQVSEIIGTATSTRPEGSAPAIDRQGTGTLLPSLSGEKTTRLGMALADLKGDPDAAWFYLRLFWLLAAFILWVQNYLVGLLALIPSLVPVFYLARALPLAYVRIKEQPWLQRASEIVSDDHAGRTWLAEYSAIFAAILIALPTFLILLLFWRQLRGILGNGLKRFLHPDLYQVRFNGRVFDFSRDGKDLVVEGLHFKASRMVQDRKKPELWRLGSGTELEFIPRERP